MDVSTITRRSFAPLSRDEFENLRKTVLIPAENLTGLQLFREKAANERNLQELYRDRAPFELIQNADDAGATAAAFVICSDGFAFGHDGNWFSVENFRSLAEGWSNKKPGECIGHKGLGFRSVLDVSPSPVLGRISNKDTEQFAIKFSWKNNEAFVQRVLTKSPDLRTYYDSWTRNGQSACPIMAIPRAIRIDSLGGGTASWNRLRALNHTTLFWFPAIDPDLPSTAAAHLNTSPITSSSGKDRLLSFLDGEMTVVLPFLRTLKLISVFEGSRQLLTIDLDSADMVRKPSHWTRASVLHSKGTTNRRRDIFQVGTTCRIPPNIKNDPQTPIAARTLNHVAVTLAVELVDGEPSALRNAPFYVYFPTEDRTGTGFIVHADFHVEPHRKHLMSGALNDWICKEAARLAAGPFLTEMLERFTAKATFNALGPSPELGSSSFTDLFAAELRSRKAPFVPTRKGLEKRERALLAPNEYQSAYFETDLSESLKELRPDFGLVSADVDSARTRQFLKMANVEVLESSSLIDLIEHAAKRKNRAVEWWLRAYSQLLGDSVVSTYKRDQFEGRDLVPGETGILTVPTASDAQLCLPPVRARTTPVPAVFSTVFSFVNSELAAQLDDVQDSVSAWVRDRFAITRFEASELLPRAVRAVNTKLFTGESKISTAELAEMWRFVQALSSTSRMQSADDVWSIIGRLPLVTESAFELSDALSPASLTPAFLLYLPDTHAPGEAWIHGLPLPRANTQLLNEICNEHWSAEWLAFFHSVGVSASPKLLEYSRVPGLAEAQLSASLPSTHHQYTGERQRDENDAVLEILRNSQWWPEIVESAEYCGHNAQRLIQSIHVIDGLSECSIAAQREYSVGEDGWKNRLLSLAKRIAPLGLPIRLLDSGYCRARGGHSIELRSAVRQQLASTPWLPSSRGPADLAQCFLRQPMHRIISGTSDFGELNDAILPYVVTDDLGLFGYLARAGIRILETVRGQNAEVLSAALNEIGRTLSTEWGKENVLAIPQRWRAVRGTLQEVFRSLNQLEDLGELSIGLLPVRTSSGPTFATQSVWYADPGVLRDAFTGVLPLLDADRAYSQFFKASGVVQLVTGESVIEELTFREAPSVSENLKRTIIEDIGPYLLAMIASRSESEDERELSSKRLQERFSVALTPVIQLAFILAADKRIRVDYSARRYYLQRRLVAQRGAVEEAQFTLYIAHPQAATINDLDADAVGVHLATVLQDHPSAEMEAICARITTRFKEVSGDPEAMKEFMYNHLQVSTEVQDIVAAGPETQEVDGQGPPTPPPIVVTSGSSQLERSGELSLLVEQQQERAATEATNLVGRITRPEVHGASSAHPQGQSGRQPPDSGLSGEGITDEQAERGTRDEEEMKRRLCLPGGWAGFTFKADVRSPGCGYDFGAERSGHDVRIEVKTFSPNGRIMFTSRELREAATDGPTYFLVGLLDDGGPEKAWQSYLVPNPLGDLLRIGSFSFEARLQLDATQLCALAS